MLWKTSLQINRRNVNKKPVVFQRRALQAGVVQLLAPGWNTTQILNTLKKIFFYYVLYQTVVASIKQ